MPISAAYTGMYASETYTATPANVRLVRFVDSFPTTVTGKIQMFKIRQQEIRERSLEDTAKTQTA